MKQTWFVSHPSGGPQHTPTFFNAIDHFAREHSKIAIVFPHTTAEEVHLTKKAIETCDRILVEISIPSTGSGIEMGWANAVGKPITAFHQGGSEHSPAVKFATEDIHVYITEDDIVEQLGKLVS